MSVKLTFEYVKQYFLDHGSDILPRINSGGSSN